jgi:L-lactate dehydrogenase complex protein LldG
MEDSTSREKVLKKIRNALIYKSDNPFPDLDLDKALFNESDESIDITFAQEFTSAGGKFVFCEDEAEFAQSLKYLVAENKWERLYCNDPKLIDFFNKEGVSFDSGEKDFQKIKVGVTLCEAVIARTGSVVVSSKQSSGRRLNVFPEVHVVLAYASQLFPDIKDALKAMKVKYQSGIPSMISVVTGPSRTADIEKTLVYGAHGPKELYVFFIDDNLS